VGLLTLIDSGANRGYNLTPRLESAWRIVRYVSGLLGTWTPVTRVGARTLTGKVV